VTESIEKPNRMGRRGTPTTTKIHGSKYFRIGKRAQCRAKGNDSKMESHFERIASRIKQVGKEGGGCACFLKRTPKKKKK